MKQKSLAEDDKINLGIKLKNLKSENENYFKFDNIINKLSKESKKE
jgi:hypothetical protein